MNVVFVCTMNKMRSATAEVVARAEWPEWEYRSCGTDKTATVPMSDEMFQWADMVVYMEKEHKNKAEKKCKSAKTVKSKIVMGVPDEFDYMDVEFIKVFKSRFENYVRAYFK